MNDANLSALLYIFKIKYIKNKYFNFFFILLHFLLFAVQLVELSLYYQTLKFNIVPEKLHFVLYENQNMLQHIIQQLHNLSIGLHITIRTI